MPQTGFAGRAKGAAVFEQLFLKTEASSNDPAGLFTHNGVPTSGAAGTLVGRAARGSLLSDTSNGKLYVNTGTLASPTWTVVGSQS